MAMGRVGEEAKKERPTGRSTEAGHQGAFRLGANQTPTGLGSGPCHSDSVNPYISLSEFSDT